MYHRTLHIGLFGLADDVAAAIEGAQAFDRFSHDVVRHAALDAQAFCASDIVILGEPAIAARSGHAGFTPSRDLHELVAHRREARGARFGAVIAVVGERTAWQWSAEDYALVDAVWPAPLTVPRALFEFDRLQRAAKQDADLHLARTYLDTAIDSTPELIWFKDARGAHLKVNDAFCATVEKTKEQIEGRGHYYIWDITPEEYATGEYVCLESEDETMAAGRTCLFDEQVKTKRGMRQFKTYKSPLFDEDGSVMGTVGIAHDVTDLGNITTELEIFINSMPFAIVVLDVGGTIINVNDRTEEYFDVKRSEVLGGNFDGWRRRVLSDAVVDSNSFSDSSSFSACIGGVDKVFAVNDRVILDVFGNVTGQLRIYRDITSERALEEQTLMNAQTDYLTGLFNRRYFYEYLDERGMDELFALVALDLDDFKSINDRYGHAVGDEALLKTSSILREAFPDCPAIRWGGDEFIVAVFGERSLEDLRAQSLAMLGRLSDESRANGYPELLTGSVGIAVADDPRLTIDDLIKLSDEALYRAKRAGKSRCCVHGRD